jgi:hypothetical protein
LARFTKATNEDENDLAERHLASAHEVFSVGGVWKEITLTARRKRLDQVFGRDTRLSLKVSREVSVTPRVLMVSFFGAEVRKRKVSRYVQDEVLSRDNQLDRLYRLSQQLLVGTGSSDEREVPGAGS